MPRQTYDGAVAIPGLADLNRDLRAIGKDAARDLRVANKQAAELVANAARAKAEALGVPGHVVRTIRAQGEAKYAALSLGGARAPDAMGDNFGARHDVMRHTSRGAVLGWNQFPNVTKPDRFMYATIAELTPEPFMRSYEQLIDRVAKRHGFGASGAIGGGAGSAMRALSAI